MKRAKSNEYVIVGYPHGIMFHHFHDGKHPGQQGSISASDLSKIIETLRHHHHILPALEWYNKAMNGMLDSCDLCFTFDDALLCQYEVALPILEHYHLTGFWFVYTSVCTGSVEMLEMYRRFRCTCFDSIEDFYADFFDTLKTTQYGHEVNTALETFSPCEYLSDFPFYSPEDRTFRFVRDKLLDQDAYAAVMGAMMDEHNFDINVCRDELWMRESHLRDLHSRGHIVGLHSHTHPTVLANLSPEKQKMEYATNFETLRNIIGVAPIAMSHPCNSYTTDTLTILRRLGIRLGFRANMAVLPAVSELECPREDHTNIMRIIK